MNRLLIFCTLLTLLPAIRAMSAPPTIEGCPTFPADNIWNAPVDKLPVHASSASYITTIGSQTGLHPDFGAPYLNDQKKWTPIGIPYNVVLASEAKKNVHFTYDGESDPGPYPVPDNPAIEGVLPGGDQNIDGDRHILIVDKNNCILYEMFYAWPRQDGGWNAGSGAVFDLRSNALRPDGWTSADAAGLPIFSGLVRYEEVLAGEIHHALRFTAQNSHIRMSYVWPARHQANNSTSQLLPPMGQRFRLKSSVDISSFSAMTQVIFKAMKKYGLILADNGSDWFVSGVADDRWDNDTLVSEFKQLKGSDFEAVDVSSLMVDKNSGQVKGGVAPPGPPGPIGKSPAWYNLLLKE